MKSRKTIKHAELVAEVITATKSRGVLDPADIKKNIEKYVLFSSMMAVVSVRLLTICKQQIDRERLYGEGGGQCV